MASGNLSISNMAEQDGGVYECVVTSAVATMVTSTLIIVEGEVVVGAGAGLC